MRSTFPLLRRLIHNVLYMLALTPLVTLGWEQADVVVYAQPQRATEPAGAGNISTSAALVLRIGAGDLLEVTVFSGFGVPELNWKGRVGTSGDIALPFIGDVHVLGLTPEEAKGLIEQKFKDSNMLKTPQATLFISEYASQGVSVLGEVAKPGVYPVMTSRRLLDLISAAGGLTPTAGKAINITHRGSPLEPTTVLLSKDPNQNAAANIEIFPGDTIVVSKAGVVYVVGAVVKPGGFTMDANEGLTVLQAIALAEGSKPDAASNKSRLIRKTSAGPEEIPIPLNKILASQAPDVKLRAEDIVFVPSSAAKSAARRSLEAIVQTATGVAIYHPF
jgi:polysaccharide biosynthesis/export protein